MVPAMQLHVLVFRVPPGRHSDSSPAFCILAVPSEDCVEHRHGELVGSPAEWIFFLRPSAVQDSEGILHQTTMFGKNYLQLLPLIKHVSPNSQGLGQYLVEAFQLHANFVQFHQTLR